MHHLTLRSEVLAGMALYIANRWSLVNLPPLMAEAVTTGAVADLLEPTVVEVQEGLVRPLSALSEFQCRSSRSKRAESSSFPYAILEALALDVVVVGVLGHFHGRPAGRRYSPLAEAGGRA